MTSNSPIEKKAIPYGITQTEETSTISTKTNKTPIYDVAPNREATTSRKPTTDDQPLSRQEHDPN